MSVQHRPFTYLCKQQHSPSTYLSCCLPAEDSRALKLSPSTAGQHLLAITILKRNRLSLLLLERQHFALGLKYTGLIKKESQCWVDGLQDRRGRPKTSQTCSPCSTGCVCPAHHSSPARSTICPQWSLLQAGCTAPCLHPALPHKLPLCRPGTAALGTAEHWLPSVHPSAHRSRSQIWGCVPGG